MTYLRAIIVEWRLSRRVGALPIPDSGGGMSSLLEVYDHRWEIKKPLGGSQQEPGHIVQHG